MKEDTEMKRKEDEKVWESDAAAIRVYVIGVSFDFSERFFDLLKSIFFNIPIIPISPVEKW